MGANAANDTGLCWYNSAQQRPPPTPRYVIVVLLSVAIQTCGSDSESKRDVKWLAWNSDGGGTGRAGSASGHMTGRGVEADGS